MCQPFNFQQQQQVLSCRSSAGLMDGSSVSYQEELEITELSRRHSDKIHKIIEGLYLATFVQGSSQRDAIRTRGRINKNAVLALVLARLIKQKHLQGARLVYEMELLRGIRMQLNNGDFVLVLRADGRIVAMSDGAERHLDKPMRLLYAQSINIFECLDQTDTAKLRSVLNTSADLSQQEHRLVCTFRLPKGKRPSRLLEDVKTISMTGHFYSCDNLSETSFSERLFIAHCAALMPLKPTKPSSTRAATTNDNDTTGSASLTLTLNEDMSICEVSPNLSNVLGYSSAEMVDQWFGRYLPANDGDKFEALRRQYLQNEQQPQQAPVTVNEIFDIYTNGGEGRLTFLCQIRPTRVPRSKVMKFTVVAQLIDPSLRNEYAQYISSAFESQPEAPKAEQVNLVQPSVSNTSEDSIVADSPTYTNMAEYIYGYPAYNSGLHQPQSSPVNEPLSSVVAPIDVSDELWRDLFDTDDSQHSTASSDFQCWSSLCLDNAFFENKFSDEFSELVEEYLSDLFYSDQSERKKIKTCYTP